MKATIENHELVFSCEINETLAKKLLDYPDRVVALEHDLHIRHAISHSKNGEWTSTVRMKLAEGDDLIVLMTKLKESHTTLLEQASAWKKPQTKISEKQKKDISESVERIWEETHKKAMKDKPEDASAYVCLKRTKRGYEVEGNMPLEEVIQTLASMFISYATKK